MLNKKSFSFCVVAGFIFVFLFEMLVHGFALMGMYEQTQHLWRGPEDMNMPFMAAMQFIFVIITAFIFTRHYEGKGIGEGVRFGAYIGLLLGFVMLSFYAFMPIPFALALCWFFASLFETIGLGVIYALLYKK